ncbi:MAG: hypothetical protein V5783_07910 [Pontiella sp.]
MKKWMIIALLSCGFSGAEEAPKGKTLEQYLERGKQSAERKDRVFNEEKARSRFLAWDVNQDGILTAEEIKAKGKMSDNPPAMAKESPTEASQGETLEQYLERGKKAAERKDRVFNEKKARVRFKAWDVNQDGVLTTEEIKAKGMRK